MRQTFKFCCYMLIIFDFGAGCKTKVPKVLSYGGRNYKCYHTNIDYLRNYFSRGKTSISIFYRRKYGDKFKQAAMDMILAGDYEENNQTHRITWHNLPHYGAF